MELKYFPVLLWALMHFLCMLMDFYCMFNQILMHFHALLMHFYCFFNVFLLHFQCIGAVTRRLRGGGGGVCVCVCCLFVLRRYSTYVSLESASMKNETRENSITKNSTKCAKRAQEAANLSSDLPI